MSDLLLTTAEVAAIMGCSKDTVRRRVADGTLHAIRLTPTGPLRFNRDVLPMEGNIMVSKRFDRGGWPYVDFRYTDERGRSRRVRVKCPSRDPRSCRQFEQEVRAKVAAGVWRSEKETTVRDFAPVVIDYLEVAQRKRSYIEMTKKIFENHLVPFFGSRAIRSLMPADIIAYKKAKKHLSKGGLNNHLVALSRMFTLAIENKIITERVNVGRETLKEQEVSFWTGPEATKLEAACKGRLLTMLIVALGTGLRMGELIALQWGDIDFSTASVHVRRQWCQVAKDFTLPKSNERRVVPLPPRVVEALREWKAGAPAGLPNALVFTTAKGNIIAKQQMNDSLRRACKRAGLVRAGWHKCRHTYASWLVQRGVSLYVVQELLGHKTVAQTQRYAHLAQTTLADAVSVLG